MIKWLSDLFGDFSISYALYGIIGVLIVAVVFMWYEHNHDIEKISQQSSVISAQNETLSKLNKQIEVNQQIIQKSEASRKKIEKDSSHEKELYERYFRIYGNKCSDSGIPNSVVKRLRKIANGANEDSTKAVADLFVKPYHN